MDDDNDGGVVNDCSNSDGSDNDIMNPSGPLINRLKWFFLKIPFREDIRILILKNSTLRRLTLHGVDFF